jgi:hypothetical protein
VAALSDEVTLPDLEVAVATLYAEHIEADLLAVLERARSQELEPAQARLLFRGLHILGGRQITAAYRPLIAFLRGPREWVDDLLGDATTETLPKILAGVFDGDQEPLRALATDSGVDPFICDAALAALAFHCFEGRIDRHEFEAFLLSLDEQPVWARDNDVMWHAWMTVIGVLGFEHLVPRVRAAFADGRIAPHWCDEDEFDELLRAAIERPHDRSRLEDEHMGYIADVLQELERFHWNKNDGGSDDPSPDDEMARWKPAEPARNPFRGVGRNDPCPCGSGKNAKKAKKCCLQ